MNQARANRPLVISESRYGEVIDQVKQHLAEAAKLLDEIPEGGRQRKTSKAIGTAQEAME